MGGIGVLWRVPECSDASSINSWALLQIRGPSSTAPWPGIRYHSNRFEAVKSCRSDLSIIKARMIMTRRSSMMPRACALRLQTSNGFRPSMSGPGIATRCWISTLLLFNTRPWFVWYLNRWVSGNAYPTPLHPLPTCNSSVSHVQRPGCME